MNKKEKRQSQKNAIIPIPKEEGAGEYGLGNIMNPSEDELTELRKTSGYHFSGDQLEHKGDRIDEDQSNRSAR